MTGGSILDWGARLWLNLLWALPLLGVLLVWAQRRRRVALERMASAPVLGNLVPRDLGERRSWQTLLLLLGLALMVAAVAQPWVGFQWRDVERRGIDLALVVDVSSSMDAQDVSPSRMERARREVLDLCRAAPGDRLGLVVFAGGAYPRVPLTLDHHALLTILREVDTNTLQAQGSSLPAAIREALRLLQGEEQTHKAILLLSDGEIPDTEAALAAAKVAGEAGVSVYVVGVGTPEGAPIPLEEGGFKKDRQGQVVVSKLDESLLRRLAAAAGGAYVRSVASVDDVEALVAEIHGDTEGELLGVHREKVPNEYFQWPLGAGLVLIVLGLVLGVPRRGAWTVVAVLLALGVASPVAHAGVQQDGIEALGQGDFARASELLMQHHLSNPDDMDTALALGQSLLQEGRPNEAERVWELVAERTTDSKLRALARYDMGHAAYRGGRLTQAHEHFQRAAEIDPELEAATKNAQAVAQEIAARTQDPEQQPKGECDNPQEGQDGQQKEGEQQEGQDEQQEGQDEQQEGQDGPEDEGQRDQPEDPQEPPEGEIAPATGEPGAAGEDGGVPLQLAPGELTPEQALDRLEEVEEGSPRVVIQGKPNKDQDW